jgi:outer membrane protein OmpA-like peptidoglycan-associated protein
VEAALVSVFVALMLAFPQEPPSQQSESPEPVSDIPAPAPAPARQAPRAIPTATPVRPYAGLEVVIVVPSADGHVGTVVVERDGERVVLNQAYAASRIQGTSGPQRVRLPEEQVTSTFASTLTALPARPMSFLLYFLRGTDMLAEESKAELERMLAEVRRRASPDILVVGHTDTVGSPDANDALSLQRAQRVKTDLLTQGISAARVRATGRGERELLVPTGDNVDEPRNRRVEISVR